MNWINPSSVFRKRENKNGKDLNHVPEIIKEASEIIYFVYIKKLRTESAKSRANESEAGSC